MASDMAKAKGSRRSAKQGATAPSVRASQVLLEILSKNPDVENFTVQKIVETIGGAPAGASLMLFSLPGFVPTFGASDLAGLPTGAVAGQMIAGRKELKLPNFILEKTVSRRSLAIAIHAVMPFLKRAEKAVKPRWTWTSHPISQRVLGVLIFVLALAIAVPFLGFNAPHAAAIFIISMGMVEKDGLAILIGVIAGVASLAFAAVGFSKKQLHTKALDIIKALWERLTLERVSAFFRALVKVLKSLWSFDWPAVLRLWDAQRSAPVAKAKQPRAKRPATTDRRADKRIRRPALVAKSASALALPPFSRAAV